MHDDTPETDLEPVAPAINDEAPGFDMLADADAENNVADQNNDQSAYQVLARKYRPQNFDDLIGQEAMVRTLQNAFTSGRIAHAFMLTGVRGVGKTTTARILARALNYETATNHHPSTDLSEEGVHCAAIMEGRHVDVMEMDAASRTGIGDIREIIESVRYRPTSARFKVYIIDEVHMLSTAAFNGLLKTLEEPPPHVKFIFATTEIQRVPVTVLSRCQRFDLRRLSLEDSAALIDKVCTAEHVSLGEEARGLIARAAEGSARDALSLLDRALAHAGEAPENLDGDTVRHLLGLADRGRIFDLFDCVMRGDVAAALTEFEAHYAMGAEPVVVITDLADVTHWVTRIKFIDDVADDVTLPADQRQRGRDMAAQLSMRHLSRAWQFLQKGQQETQIAANPKAAAEMVLMRLAHLSDLPTPDELVRSYQANPPADGGGAGAASQQPAGGSPSASSQMTAAPSRTGTATHGRSAGGQVGGPAGGQVGGQAARPATQAMPAPETALAPQIADFTALLAFVAARADLGLRHALEHDAILVSFLGATDERAGHIELGLAPERAAVAQELTRKLRQWTHQHWVVSVSSTATGNTLAAEKQARDDEKRQTLEADPLVKAVLAAFPEAEITTVSDFAADAALGLQDDALDPDAPQDDAELDPDGD